LDIFFRNHITNIRTFKIFPLYYLNIYSREFRGVSSGPDPPLRIVLCVTSTLPIPDFSFSLNSLCFSMTLEKIVFMVPYINIHTRHVCLKKYGSLGTIRRFKHNLNHRRCSTERLSNSAARLTSVL